MRTAADLDVAGSGEKGGPGLRQLHPSGLPSEELDIQFLLQSADLDAQGGLLDAQSFGATEQDDTISAAARSDLVESIYTFLADPDLRDFEHPIGVLQIRPAFRLVVAELQELIGGWGDDQMLALQREQLQEQLRDQFMRISGPGTEFFDFDRAAARVGYQRSEPRPEEPE